MPAAFKLVAGGDLCPADHYFTVGHGFAHPWRVQRALEPLAHLFDSADLAMANLEAPISNCTSAEAEFERRVFLGDPKVAPILKAAGLNCLHLANNHILQHGPGPFEDTIDFLHNVGIKAVGFPEKDKAAPLLLSAKGVDVAVLAVSLVPDRFFGGQYNRPRAEELIEQAKRISREVDHLILSIHWGTEGPEIPSASEVFLGRQLIEAGVSVILGHHSHAVRPVERWESGLICYSLGNLVFDLEWFPPYSLGMLAEITLGRKGVPPLWKPHFFRCRRGAITLLPEAESEGHRNQLARNARWLQTAGKEEIELAHRTRENAINRSLPFRKLLFFLAKLPCGDTASKLAFLLSKMRKNFQKGPACA